MDNAVHGFHGDRPLEPGTPDHFGLRPVAEALAAALVDISTAEGFVFGVEGTWGSGKTSLLRLTQAALETRVNEARPAIVPFSPWLVREREALITEVSGNLARRRFGTGAREKTRASAQSAH